MKIHLLWTSEWGRQTNTEYHLWKMQEAHPELKSWEIARAQSNALALKALLESKPEDSTISLAPYYNVHGKWVKDTMEVIAKNYSRLKLLHISRLQVDYILVHRHWIPLADMKYVVSHEQAIAQTRKWWNSRGLPSSINQIWGNNTAAGLDFLLSDDSRVNSTIAISTPWQWRRSDGWILTRTDNFGPEENHTYFGIFWLKDSDINLPFNEASEDNPDRIEFWVIELDDTAWSLARALANISASGKNIHSIKSFPQGQRVLFVIAYSKIASWTSETSLKNKRPIISEIIERDEIKPYYFMLSIPNTRWSLGITLSSFSHLVNIRSIESIGTSREDADFIIEVAPWNISSEDLLSYIEEIIEKINYTQVSQKWTNSNTHKFHTLQD